MKKYILHLLGFILFCSTTKAQQPAPKYKYKILNDVRLVNNWLNCFMSFYEFNGSTTYIGSSSIWGTVGSFGAYSGGTYGYCDFNAPSAYLRSINVPPYNGYYDYKVFDGVIESSNYLYVTRRMEKFLYSRDVFPQCDNNYVTYNTSPITDNSLGILMQELIGVRYGIQNTQVRDLITDGLDLSRLEIFLLPALKDINNSNLTNISVCKPLYFNVLDVNNQMTFAIDAKLGIETENNPYVEIYPYTKQYTRGMDMSLEKLKEKGLRLDPYQSFTIRVRYSSVAMTELNTEKITYKYVECAPEIAASTTTKTTCSDTKDGKVVLELKRAFKLNESFNVGSLNIVGITSPLPFFSEGTPEGYKFKLNATKDEIEISNLAPASYILKYNTFFGNLTENKLTQEIIHPFTISAPMPLKFTVSALNPLCHDGSTTLSIVAQGGSGKYFYQINEETKVAFDADSTPATQEIEMQITDSNKDLEIKVTDSNNCIETDN